MLLVLDASQPLAAEDRELLDLTKDKKRIVVLNKQDLPQQLDMAALANLVPEEQIIRTSMLDVSGVDALDKQIKNLFFGGIENSQSTVMVTNARQSGLLRQPRRVSRAC